MNAAANAIEDAAGHVGPLLGPNPTLVVKIGTSSITQPNGRLDADAIGRLCGQLAACRARGARIVLVSSGAIAAGLPHLGYDARPGDLTELQAIAAVGQVRLMDAYTDALSPHGIVAGQVLLTRHDIEGRGPYLHARTTLRRLLDMGVLAIVNENDTVADDEIRFGENDRLSALVAHLIAADLLVLLTDQAGLYTADPRFDEAATLIEEVHRIDAELEAAAGDAGSPLGSGGMASKLAAAKMAAWSGVPTVIGEASRADLLIGLLDGNVHGTLVRAHERRLASRKLWIAFAQRPLGVIDVDAGAVRALRRDGTSLLAVGVVAARGDFAAGDPVEICGPDGTLVAKGLARIDRQAAESVRGTRDAPIVVHRDDMVVLT